MGTNGGNRRFVIGLMSDIHLHRPDNRDAIDELIAHVNRAAAPDLLVLAGDVSHRTREVREFLGRIRPSCPRCWVPGNHDIWVIDAESPEDTAESRYTRIFPEISREAGWHYLPARPLVAAEETLTVIGSIGWFTGPGYSEWFDSDGGSEDEELAARFATELRAQAASAPPESCLVMVTHHVSHSMIPTHDPLQGNTWSRHLESFIRENASRIAAVLHGHRHRRYEPLRIDGVLFAAHPFGYPHQHERPEDGYREVVVEISSR